ncbi:hypothetical protein EUX98_g3736 [Antrodiella citrinella]|uniref:NAD-dependent epimerase/dehydratase domain-containing protein n=1 Tax=Antrodiella citrinella TaxID=2447956 RepID=A0A4S4MXW1_9APHY|nr:hypothetical protein EUX98_g3736 [Antrodiella citrinella]
MSGDLVLVIGVSGYLGAHVVDRLVKDEYRVRGTARSAKLYRSREAYAVYGEAVEIIAMNDLANGDYPDAFKGVDAVIHVAATMIGREAEAEAAIRVSMDGSLDILAQAERAGVKNFSFVRTIGPVTDGIAMGKPEPVKGDEWVAVTRLCCQPG